MSEIEHHTVVGERTVSSVSGSTDARSAQAKRGIAVIALIGAAGAFLWLTWNPDKKDDAKPPQQIAIRQTNAFEPAREPPPQPLPAPTPPPVAAIPAPPVPAEPAAPPVDPLLDSARRAPVLAFNKPGAPKGNGAPGAAAGPGTLPPGFPGAAIGGAGGLGAAALAGGEEPRNELQDKLEVTVLEGSSAATLGNRNYVVAMGTSIPCVLETALSSDVPGFVSCVINRDVLSDNGRVVLMEKGTQVVGEFRGQLKRGQKRLFVLWNRAKTPKGVIVRLASPATDALGRAGFDGEIDSHFWERFGGALLMSVVNDLSGFANDKLKDSNVDAGDSSKAGKEAASIAIEQSINIPPTLYKNQGEMVSIFVARDLDFSKVYSLHVTETRQQIYDRAVLGDFSKHDGLVSK